MFLYIKSAYFWFLLGAGAFATGYFIIVRSMNPSLFVLTTNNISMTNSDNTEKYKVKYELSTIFQAYFPNMTISRSGFILPNVFYSNLLVLLTV